MFDDEKERILAITMKEAEFKTQINKLQKENDVSKKERYEIEKAATQSHIEIQRQKKINLELMQAIKFAKQNPQIILQINKNYKPSSPSKDLFKQMKSLSVQIKEKEDENQNFEKQIKFFDEQIRAMQSECKELDTISTHLVRN